MAAGITDHVWTSDDNQCESRITTRLIGEIVASDLRQLERPITYYREKFRPQYHFSPEEGFINDPNGLVYYDGEYHLFFQYNPFDLHQDPNYVYWGHAISTDLLHWQHMPLRLGPDELGSLYSGSAVVDWNNSSGFFDGKPGLVAFFAYSDWNVREEPGLAYSRGRGRSWTKYEGNPVIPNPGVGSHFRDPKVFWYKPTERWIMVLGGGPLRIYSSENLIDWVPECTLTDIESECPDLFELPVDGDADNTKWVLNLAGRFYYIGFFDGHRFTPESDKIIMNYGPDAYAAQTWSDIPEEDGRRIMVNWMMSWQYANRLDIIPTRPWNGSMSIPHVLTLKKSDQDILLIQNPIEELISLRTRSFTCENIAIAPGSYFVPDIRGMCLEIEAEFELGTATEFGLEIRQSDRTRRHTGVEVKPIEGEKTVIGYDVSAKELYVDRRETGTVYDDLFARVFRGPLTPRDNRIRLHLLIDWSSVETFANDGELVISTLIFPTPFSENVRVFARGGIVELLSMHIHKIKSVWY